MSASKNARAFAAGAEDTMRAAVARIVERTPVTDMHTHIYAQPFGGLLLYGVDELLTYHYLVAEELRLSPIPYDTFYAMDKQAQADLIWQNLFIERSPVSESCRGVLTALKKLGLDTAARDLAACRAYFAEVDLNAHVAKVFETANVSSVVMTNDPFDDTERPVWESGYAGDPRFHAALRIDPLFVNWACACERLKGFGYDVEPSLTAHTSAEIRRFLTDWVKRMGALYMAVSLSPDFAYPDNRPATKIIDECIVPVSRELNVPFAMMIGVKRQINPGLRLAGDGVGTADVGSVERLCAAYPGNKFMVTMLSRENQHTLCVTARKFRNLCLFGCWWFLNDPSLIEEMTRMRLELLGLSVIPQHSDARVLEQIIYKWSHSRAIIAKVLGDKYAGLLATGWTLSEAEIERDAAMLLGGNFWEFLK